MHKSRLVLGTAQLGMRYGISNTAGQPSRKDALNVLDAAYVSGINTFDTASAYGEAEETLGEWLKQSRRAAMIITKMKPYEADRGAAFVIEEIEKSLKKLHVEALDGYLIHSPRDLRVPEVVEGLMLAKERGLVRHIGASVYDDEEVEDALSGGVEYLQVPYNAFDQRFGRREFLDRAVEQKVTVFARSPFLQGLLLMAPAEIPTTIEDARPYLEQFIALSERHGLSCVEAALGFALAEMRIPHIVVGAVSASEVRELSSVRAVSEEVVDEMRKLFGNIPRTVTDPRLWKKSQ